MKLVEDNEVVLGSTSKSKSFTIEASAKAFVILSDKLYRNKPRAIVREIATNCLDAHVLNKNQGTPFNIKAPNKMDPRLIMRDFGPGLDQDAIENMLTTYFASTKTNSNDFIGALGLGFKSPFAYTETFNITSYHKGKIYGYMAVRNNGEPDLRPLFVEDMKEDDLPGLEVTVPIKENDIAKFNEEIAYITRTFDVQPNISGASITVKKFPDTQAGEWFSTRNSSDFGGFEPNGGMYAIYGRIVYPIPQLDGMERAWLIQRYGTVYINFPLGSLDITPSREELSLDPRTIETLCTFVNDLEAKTLEADVAKFNEITNLRELTRQLNELTSAQRNILANKQTKFQGHTILELNSMFNSDPIKHEIEAAEMSVYQVNSDTKKQRLTSSWGSRTRVNANRLLGVNNRKVHFMIDDKPSYRAATFRGMHRKAFHDFQEFIMIDEENARHMSILGKVTELFKGDEVIVLRLSELDEYRKIEKAAVSSGGASGPRPKAANVVRMTYDVKNSPSWSSEDLFLNKEEILELEGYAIGRSRDEVRTLADEYVGNLEHSTVQNLAYAAGIREYYVIRPTAMKAAGTNEELDCLFRRIVDKYISALDMVDYDDYIPTGFFNKRMIAHINTHKEINWLLGLITGSSNTKKLMHLNGIAQLLRYSNMASTSQLAKDLLLANKIYNTLIDAASGEFAKSLKKFEEDYPVVHYMLNEYDIRKQVADIDRIMKALTGATNQGENNV